MQPITHRTFAAVAASVAALCALASQARAQSSNSGDPYRTVVVAAASPYWGYTYNPYASYLHGVAAVTRANGDYLKKTQQAAMLREKVRRAKLETRRLQLEHWEWERDFRAEARKRERERVHQAEVERARKLPPLTEILSASPHNKILDELRQLPDLPSDGSVKVESEWLAHIHVSVDGHGNLGLLKDDRIFWPQLLTRSDFAPTCERIEQLFARAKEQALDPRNGRIDPALLRELRQSVAECTKHFDREWSSDIIDPAWNPRHFTEANRFLKQVRAAIYVLEKPDAATFLNPLRGATVAELVAHMKKEGIRFAAATVGCERYYIALHRALADELTRLKPPDLAPSQSRRNDS
ncbi:MAG TPA: hypothetical protein VMG10_30835 [Gemmataceae bacterium]|nr:hypothetical protein [Gemmataceae bacterium]